MGTKSRTVPLVAGRRSSSRALTVAAMARTVHVCTECGHESAGWLGRCPGCGEWNTLVEERPAASPPSGRATRTGAARPIPLSDVKAPPVERLRTGLTELARVPGDGIVPGSLVLLGRSPG